MDPAVDDIEAVRGYKLSKHLANPGPLGFGAFATTLMTLSLSMMGLRAVSNQTVFITNLCFLAGLGLLISAQWEMVKGNTFNYTVLTAFGFYYGGYGVLLMPPLAVIDSYGGKTTEYYNAFGLYLLVWSILNFFFFLASLPTNTINITIYGALELSYIFNCMGNFFMANTDVTTGTTLIKVAGAFGFTSSVAGFYMLCHDLCQHTLPFRIPLFETSHFFSRPGDGAKGM
ncbi:GPR1/FUN34/yaaH family-domain-containing protein [Aspergillus recurvatus]